MKNTYSYTVPDLSSLEDNEIKDLSSVELLPYELRILYLNGSFVRIEINPKSYCEINSYDEIKLNEEDKKSIENLMNSFFYGKAYLFGIVNEQGLLIYDIYTNDNYLSSRDLQFLNKNFGLKIAETLYDGFIHYDSLIANLFSQINAGKYIECIHILPSMYLNDKREYSYVKEELKKEVIIGEKPVVKTYNTWNGSSYTYPTKAPVPATTNTTPAIIPTTKKTEKIEINNQKEVFKLTTKQERTDIFREVLKNLRVYVNDILPLSQYYVQDFWKKHGAKFAYLYAIYTLPKTRHLVYNFLKENKSLYSYTLNGYFTNSDFWAEVFIDMFEQEHSTELKNFFSVWTDFTSLSILFKEEFKAFSEFYKKEVPDEDKIEIGGDYDIY